MAGSGRSEPPGPGRLASVVAQLRRHARPQALDGMARYGIVGDGRLGVSIPTLRNIAREIGRDHELALELFATHVPDAQMLAALLAEPRRLTTVQMDDWAASFVSWDVCDQVCNNLFRHSPRAWGKVGRWARRRDEFVRRAAFSLLAVLAVHDKEAPDERFIAALPLLEQAAGDERNYVKKAVSWALRNIGKRNAVLASEASGAARRIALQPGRAARWIAADVLRELEDHTPGARQRR